MQPGTRQITAALALLVASIQLATCVQNLEEKYPFSTYLEDGYKVHWNFDLKQQTIAFALNVSATGWVGFGISPNGRMYHSDIVIGWVNRDGTSQFHVSWYSITCMYAVVSQVIQCTRMQCMLLTLSYTCRIALLFFLISFPPSMIVKITCLSTVSRRTATPSWSSLGILLLVTRRM